MEGPSPVWLVRLAAAAGGSESSSMSRDSGGSEDSGRESATERGIEGARVEALVEAAALLAPGKGIPALAPVGPMALWVDRMMKAEAGQPVWLSRSRA